MNSHNFPHDLTDHCLIDDLDLKIWPKKICISSHLNGHLIFCVIRILEKDERGNNILAIPSTNRTIQNSSRAQSFRRMGQFLGLQQTTFLSNSCLCEAPLLRTRKRQYARYLLQRWSKAMFGWKDKLGKEVCGVGAEGHEALSRTMLVFSGNWDDTHRGVICLKTTSRRGPSTLTLVVRDALMMVVR